MSILAQSHKKSEPRSATGPGHFKVLPKGPEDKACGPFKICVIAGDKRRNQSPFLGRLGGDLVKAGHKVTFVYCDGKKGIKTFSKNPITHVFVPSFDELHIKAPLYIERAYKIYLWLKDQKFDVIYYMEQEGLGHYISIAKRQGLVFQHTALCVLLAGPKFYLSETSGQFPKTVNELGIDFMERESVASADIAIALYEDIYTWMIKQAWVFPKVAYVQEEKSESRKPSSNWLSWYSDIHLKPDAKPKVFKKETAPLVSICMPHHNRPNFLDEAVLSIEAQDYPNFEVILVDDGSTDKKALEKLKELEPLFKKKKWRIIRQENLWQGAAINKAAQYAKGEYLLFMDDDNWARPEEISTFVRVAEKTRADILTCFLDTFNSVKSAQKIPKSLGRYLFIGPSIPLGAFQNGFGDNNALIRREVFLALGGFSEIYGVGHTDWEFFARAALKNYYLEVIPEALFMRRVTGKGMLDRTHAYKNRRLSLEPYLTHMPTELRDILLLAHGMSQMPKV